MPRNITVSFSDGTQHVYQNAPDNLTPDAVITRAQQESGKTVSSVDGGRGQGHGLVGGVTDDHKPAPDGVVGSSVRGLANGLTAGWADKAAAGLESVIPGIGNAGTQTVWSGHSLSDAYNHNKQIELAQTKSDETAHPWISGAANVGGAVTLAAGTAGLGDAVGLGKVAQLGTAGRVAAAVAPDAAYGAAYGAGQSNAATVAGQAGDAAYGAAGGIIGRGIGVGIGKVVGGIASGVTDPVMRDLAARGVQFTPGQAIGGFVGGLERKLTSIPITGGQIEGRLADSQDQWNTATIQRALDGYGAKLPNGATGSDAFAFGQKAVDGAFDKARSGLVVSRTPEFDTGLQAIRDKVTSGGVDALPEDLQRRFENVVQNNVLRKFNSDGVMSPQDYSKASADLMAAARKQTVGTNPADMQDYGRALESLAGHLDTAALSNPASDPAAVSLMNKARSAYPLWALAQKAADNSGSLNAGRFTPAQYLRAVEQGDTSVRNHLFTEGNAFDQQWGQNASNALGRNIPNSGSADRYLAAKLMGEGGGVATAAALGHPMIGMGALGADLGGAAAYSKPVNAFANKLMFGGGNVRAQVGQKVNAMMPAVRKLGGASGAVLGIQAAQKSTP